MPAPLLLILAGAAGLAAIAMSKKSSATAASSGVPSYPVAAGALNSGAGQIGATASASAPAPAPVAFLPPPITVAVPVAVAAPPTAGTVTLTPVTIVGPVVGAPAPVATSTAPWDAGTMVLPGPSTLPAIPGNYTPQSQETTDVQTALNNWAAAVGFQAIDANGANLVPLTVDGLYGPDTQLAAAGFQVWSNATANSGLAVDGLAGPMTQTPLLDWGAVAPGGAY